MPGVPTAPPGATTDIVASYITDTVAPSTPGALWEVYDRATSTVVATDISPNGCAMAKDGLGGFLETYPANMPQGGDPDGLGRYQIRFAPAFLV